MKTPTDQSMAVPSDGVRSKSHDERPVRQVALMKAARASSRVERRCPPRFPVFPSARKGGGWAWGTRWAALGSDVRRRSLHTPPRSGAGYPGAGLRSLPFVLLVIVGCVLGKANVSTAQEWLIASPEDGAVLKGDVRCIPVYVRKPLGGNAILRVTFLNEQGGLASNLPIGPGRDEIVSVHQNGQKFATGDYRLEIYADLNLDQLKARIDIRVEENQGPVNLPSLDSPVSGQKFPYGVPKIRFLGKSSCRVYLGIKKSLKPVFIVTVDPHPNLIWEVDIPWSYGPGVYTVDIFLFDPTAFSQVAEDGATFEVLPGEEQPPTPWRSFSTQESKSFNVNQ